MRLARFHRIVGRRTTDMPAGCARPTVDRDPQRR